MLCVQNKEFFHDGAKSRAAGIKIRDVRCYLPEWDGASIRLRAGSCLAALAVSSLAEH